MSYSLIDLSENAQDNRYPITNDFGLLYIAAFEQTSHKQIFESIALQCFQKFSWFGA